MLTKSQFRACQTLLSAARRGADFDQVKSELRTLGVPEQTWRELYERLGLKVLINGSGDDVQRYVYAPDKLLPFAPRTISRRVWPAIPERRSNGAA